MTEYRKIAFLFPGQGAQYPGMGKDFAEAYSVARATFEEADDILKRKLSRVVFEGPQETLTETRNSQTGIYVTSMAMLRTLQQMFPEIKPWVCAGHSLGEYSALTAAGKLLFADCLDLVQHRSQYMNEACVATKGTMAVVLGLDGPDVEQMVRDVNLPNDLWAANFNCPGQVVISGTLKGIEAGTEAAKTRGAKRVLALPVHGAFHSGLMRLAEERLAPHIEKSPFMKSQVAVVMNVLGDFVADEPQMRQCLKKQVTASVRWEQGVRTMQREGVDLFIEIGCGKTLSGMNKRIGTTAPTISIEKIEDLAQCETLLSGERR